jgi:hypothetical protein
MLFDMLAKRSHGAFLSTNNRFEFSIELCETIPLTAMEGIQQGSGQIGKRLKRELHFMLKIRVLRAFVRHTYPAEQLRCPVKPFCWSDSESRTSIIAMVHNIDCLDATADATRAAAEQLLRAET